MKSLQDMTNTDKAKLLVTLFPEHMQPLADAIKAGSDYVLKNQDLLREEWSNPIITAKFWIDIALDISGVMNSFRHDIGKSRIRFSENLFFAYRALFSIEYILRYAGATQGNTPFRLAVQMLFEPDNLIPFNQQN